MKLLILFIALVFMVTAIVIVFTETKREVIGCALVMSAIAGFGFRMVTSDDDF